jgi:hypothetical protein
VQTPPSASLADFVNGPGQRKWVLVEQARVGALRQGLGSSARMRVVESRNIKYALTLVEREAQSAPQQPAPQQQPPGRFGAPP